MPRLLTALKAPMPLLEGVRGSVQPGFPESPLLSPLHTASFIFCPKPSCAIAVHCCNIPPQRDCLLPKCAITSNGVSGETGAQRGGEEEEEGGA